jgi:NAD(P)-dependent dehydrogenase (short-subunit alcohol dehydrogenase family)
MGAGLATFAAMTTDSDPSPAPAGAAVDLTGQVALVTGASSGLGRRFAVTLAAHGAHVVPAARRVDRLDELAAEIRAAGGHCHPVPLDVTDTERLLHVLDDVEAAVGTATILVNNAGVPDAQRAHKMSIELIDQVLDTNLRGPYVLATDFARRLIAAERPGRIVNISSMGAFSYNGNGAALYSITKAAINRMTEALAVEWARFHINVNGIAPGAFASEMMDGMLSRIGDITQHFPRRRLGQPEQMDSTLLYLCDPASECVTGTIIKVDDGQGGR